MTAAETEQTPLLTNAFRSSRLGSGEATEPDRVVDVIASVARALGALKAGKLPSTRQIDDAAVTALQSEVLLAPRPPLLQGRLSTPTYHLLEHLRTSLEASRQLLKRKNATDQLQNLIFASQHLATVSSLQLESASDSSASTSQDLALSLLACQTLLWFILRSFLQESQALLSDILWALRTILADTVENASLRVEKAAQSIRPEDVTQQSQSQARQTLDSLQQRAQHQWDHEVQDRILFRLGKVFDSVRQDPESLKAVQTLLRLGRKYLDELNPNDMTFKSAPPDCLRRALEQARIAFIEFLKPWLSSVNPDDLQQKINTLIDGIQSERDIKQMALSVFDLLGNLLHHPSYANSSQASQRTRQLQQQVEDLKSKHSEWWKTLKDLLGLVEATLAEVAEDQDLQQIGKSAQSISLAILDVTRKGIFTFLGDTTGLISDVLNILLPRLLRTLTDWPFPRIEYASPSVEAVCDDFVLSELHPLPTFFRLNSQSSAEYHTRQDFVSSQTAFGVDLEAQQSLLAQSGGVHTSSTLHLRGFRFSAKNISFYVYRKALWWIPCLRAERGLLDITLAQGAEADIIFESSQSLDDQEVKSFLNISSVSFRLPGVDFRVRESFHPVLFWIARPLARAALKMAVSWALSSQLHRFLEHVDRSLYSLHIKARQYERRGYSMLAAWIAATTERADAPVPETESPASNPERDDNSHGSGLHVTNKGVIKDLNRNATGGTAMALGIGEQILGAEQHGPEHTGPSGAHGAGSGGRIITELDEETRDFLGDAVQAKRRGQELFEGFQEAVQDAPQLQRRVAEACDNEHDKSPSVTKPWYSDAFDLT